MRNRVPTIVAAGALVLTGGIAGVALGVTGSATAASVAPSPDTGSGSTSVPEPLDADRDVERVARIRAELDGLVDAGTITATQADAVAEQLAEALPGRGGRGGHPGPGGHGRGHSGPGGHLLTPEATAGALGISVEELRAAREAGRTLAEVAEEEGITKAQLVDRLVAAAETALESAVAEGRLTRAQADEISDGLGARITEKVDSVKPPKGEPHGRGELPAPEGSTTTEPSGFVTSA